MLFLFASLVALERALPHHGSLHHCTLKFSLHSPSVDSVTTLSLTSPRCAPASKISMLSGGIIHGLFRPKEWIEVKNNIMQKLEKKVAIRTSLYMLWKQHGYSFTEEQEKSKLLSTGCLYVNILSLMIKEIKNFFLLLNSKLSSSIWILNTENIINKSTYEKN